MVLRLFRHQSAILRTADRCSSLHIRTTQLCPSLPSHFLSASPAGYVAPFVRDHRMRVLNLC
jgi:hypothetical protein